MILAVPLGADPNVARDPAALVCTTTRTDVRVCVWPEHRGRLADVAEISADAIANWRNAGIDVPSIVTEGILGPAGSVRIGFTLASRSSDILADLAYGMLPAWPACADTERYPAGFAQPYLEAWFAATAGMSSEDLASRWGEDPGADGIAPVLDLVTRVRAARPSVQRDWVERNRAAMTACNAEPRLSL
jgi:hypothetical protein